MTATSTLLTCTSSTRPASPSAGDTLFETDTNKIITWSGSAWYVYEPDTSTAYSNSFSLVFDGVNDYAQSTYSPAASSGFTCSTWIKSSNTTSSMAFFSNDDSGGSHGGFKCLTTSTYKSFYISIKTSSGTISSNNNIGGSNSTLDLRDGLWHNLTVSVNGNALKIYKDGGDAAINASNTSNNQGTPYLSTTFSTADGFTANASYTGNTGNAYYFGRNGNYNGYFFDGFQDETAMWESALTGSQVSAVYNDGKPGDLTSLSPTAWWKFGDGTELTNFATSGIGSSGTVIYDMSGNSSGNITLFNGPKFSTSVPVAPFSTMSGSFDGSDDYLDCGTVSTLSSASTFSVSAWYKKASAGGGGLIIGSGTLTTPAERFYIEHFSNNTIYVGYDTTFASFSATADTDWHHVAYVRSSGTHKLYYDGADTSLSGTPASTTSSPLGNNFFIGALTGYAAKFQGIIDEVSVFSSALSASDVTSIYNSGVPANLSSLSPVHWWRIGDGTGDTDSGGGTPASGDTIGTVVDQGSGSNNATGTNGPTYSSTVPS